MSERPNDINDPKMLSELGCVPMSSEALAKMSLNPYDQLFICRLMTMRDDAAKEELYRAVAEIVAAQNKMMFDNVAEQTTMIKNIAEDISDIKKDITNILERLEDVEDQVTVEEQKQKEFDKKLTDLEKEVAMLEPELIETFITEVKELKPTLAKLIKYSSPWQTVLRILISMAVGIAMVWYIHKFIWT